MNKDIVYYTCIDSFINDCNNDTSEYMLYIAENCDFDYNKLKKSTLNFCGAIFPEVIFEKNNYKEGLVAFKLPKESNTLVIKDMSEFRSTSILPNYNSVITIVDGLSPNITSFLEQLFESLDVNSEVVGGGAGRLTFKQEPVIFNTTGIYKNAALLVGIKKNIHVGTKHGWEFLEGPLIATSTKHNLLHQINYKNAFELYKQIVEKDCGKSFNEDNFFEISKSYPLGVVKFNQKIIVRDLILKDKNSLVLVGNIIENSVINILKGEKNSIIKAAGDSYQEAVKQCKTEHKCVIMFDCISRVLYLEADFSQEINEIKKHNKNKPLFGALTLGEIANEGNIYINFFNKTCVVGLLC